MLAERAELIKVLWQPLLVAFQCEVCSRVDLVIRPRVASQVLREGSHLVIPGLVRERVLRCLRAETGQCNVPQ